MEGFPDRDDGHILRRPGQRQPIHQRVAHLPPDHGENGVVIGHLETDVRCQIMGLERLQCDTVAALVEQNTGERGELRQRDGGKDGQRRGKRQNGHHRVGVDGFRLQTGDKFRADETEIQISAFDACGDRSVFPLQKLKARLRIRDEKGRDQRRQKILADTRKGADPDERAGQPVHFFHPDMQRPFPRKNRFEIGKEDFAVPGQRDAVVRSRDEHRPELRLERADGLTHGGLSVAKLLRGTCKGFRPDSRGKDFISMIHKNSL